MSYKYKLTDTVCIMNFSEDYPRTPIELVTSDLFKALLKEYIKHSKKCEREIYNYLSKASMSDDKSLIKDLLTISRLLLIMNSDELVSIHKKYALYFQKNEMLFKLIESLYLYWRTHQRYCFISNSHDLTGLEDVSFIQAQNEFRGLILQTYRQYESSLGYTNMVYRQVISGVNAGLDLNTKHVSLPNDYSVLNSIPFIDQITLYPPFITHSKRNKRSGLYKEIDYNPIKGKTFNPDEWFCYPIMVGNLLTFVYFNIAYMSQGIALCNLFEPAKREKYFKKKPDLIYIFGYNDGQKNQVFYQDDKNKIILGYLSLSDDFDYFGYMKKMILTLHNIKKINENRLPIHGAMVEIRLSGGKTKTIVIMGDSGAGKSETIEQIKIKGIGKISSVKTIYDDMGVLLRRKNGDIVSSGTEIGAFVRLNDLDAGFGYKELDRAVFMNPDQINARLVIPITQWKDVIAKYPVDYFFYANNYDNADKEIHFFENSKEATKVFKKGQRMSKGTTNEMGITESFFANPFGPVQRRDQADKIIDEYFEDMFKQNVKVGELYTKLGIKGCEHSGPKAAADAILELIS